MVSGGQININDSKVSIRENSTGRVFIVSKADVNVNKSSLNKADVNAGTTISVVGGTTYNSDRIDDSTLTAKTSIKALNLNSINNSTLTVASEEPLTSSNFINVNGGKVSTKINNSVLSAGDIYAEKATVDLSELHSAIYMKITGANISNSTLASDAKIYAGGNAILKDSTVTGTQELSFGSTTLDNTTITLTNNNYDITDNTSAKSVTLHLEKSVMTNGSEATAPRISASTINMDNAKLTAAEDIIINNNALIADSIISSRSINAEKSTINISEITSDSTFKLGNATITDSILTAEGIVSAGGANITNSILTTPDNINAGNAKIIKSTLEGNNINSEKATIEESILTAAKTFRIGNANVSDSLLTATEDINAGQATITDSNLYGVKIYADNATIDASNLNATEYIKISRANINNSALESGKKIYAGSNANLKDSTVTGTEELSFGQTTLENTKITLNNTDYTIDDLQNVQKAKRITLHLEDVIMNNGSEATAPKISANRITMDNSTLTAIDDLNIIDGTMRNGSVANAKTFVYDLNYNLQMKNLLTKNPL